MYLSNLIITGYLEIASVMKYCYKVWQALGTLPMSVTKTQQEIVFDAASGMCYNSNVGENYKALRQFRGHDRREGKIGEMYGQIL